jgi:ferredoxin-NADP reductase
VTQSGRNGAVISPETSRTHLPTATIVRRQDFTDDLFVIWLEPGVAFTFKPGQYITIGAAPASSGRIPSHLSV